MREADEKFFAWLDGELDDADVAEMERKVAADPELARYAEQHRALGIRLHNAFDPIANAPIPAQVATVLHPRAEVIDFAMVKRARLWPTFPQCVAMAAVLAIGVFLGSIIPQRNIAPIEAQGGQLYAAAALARALDTELASAPGSGPIRIGITFRDRSGTICRSFTEQQSSGLACRSDRRWQVRGLFPSPAGQSADYRMAAGMDPNLTALIGSTIEGAPLDAAGERDAQQRGWK